MLEKTINSARRHKKILAILAIDIAELKSNNNILEELTNRFSKVLRTEDIISRLDDNTFIILLTEISKPKYASTVADKLLNACTAPIVINNQTLTPMTSIGICIYPNDGDDVDTLLNHAFAALKAVKQAGGNTYQFFSQEIDTEAKEYSIQKAALANALASNDLSIVYQPKLHIKRGNIFGVEALLRWNHPEFGTISAPNIIALAEESGLISKLGEWMLTEICKANKHWQDEGYEHIVVSINLSPKQFYLPNLASTISSILNITELRPNFLELEINEDTVMGNIDITASILDNLKETGVQLSLDHFGIGYTSISQLKKFPINSVKIDSSFIQGVPFTPNDVAITNAFIALIHNLGLDVIAEGVETEEQVQYLTAQGCDVIQGYYIGQPLPADQITIYFTKLMDKVLI